MCKIVRECEENEQPKYGYKVVFKHVGEYYGMVAYHPFKVGKAPKLDPDEKYMTIYDYFTNLGIEVEYRKEHVGKYSFFTKRDVADYNCDCDQVVLKCKVKNVTHWTNWADDKDSFLAEEVLSIEEL